MKTYYVGYTLLSQVQMKSDRMEGAVYRRSFAYVIEKIAKEKMVVENNKTKKIIQLEAINNEEQGKIHFMELPTNNYTYEK